MKSFSLQNVALSLFIISLVILSIILAKSLLVPLVISVLFAYLLYPFTWFLEKKGLPRTVSILMVILLALALFTTGILFVSVKVSNFHFDVVEFKVQIDNKLIQYQQFFESNLGLHSNTFDSILKRTINNLFSAWETHAGAFVTATTSTVFQIFILPVFTFFLLFYRTKTSYFIFKIVGRKNKLKTIQILREISTVTSKYVRGILIVVIILAILNTTGLLILGIPNAFAFGILAAVLNLIPYIGVLMGSLIPILYVLFTYTSPLQPMVQIAILFIIIQFLENNLLTPNIVGSSIRLNPFAIIISLLVANMIWGIAGMLIAVPVLAILKIIMRNVESLEPFAYLIGERGMEKHQFHMPKFIKKLFKRKKK